MPDARTLQQQNILMSFLNAIAAIAVSYWCWRSSAYMHSTCSTFFQCFSALPSIHILLFSFNHFMRTDFFPVFFFFRWPLSLSNHNHRDSYLTFFSSSFSSVVPSLCRHSCIALMVWLLYYIYTYCICYVVMYIEIELLSKNEHSFCGTYILFTVLCDV